jgi:hypothetical protein
MKKKYFKIISSIAIAGVFLVLAFGSGSSDSDEKITIDINNSQALQNYMQGKWSWEKHTGDVNHTWRYRFEIKGNKLKIWKCLNNTDDPFNMSEGYEEYNFTLGSPKRDIDGFNSRPLEFAQFDETNYFGLTYNALSPFWLISDDRFDTPLLKCGSGIASWSKAEFQVTGTKINHDDSFSNSDNLEATTSSNEVKSTEAKYMPTDDDINSIGNEDWKSYLLYLIDGVNQKRLDAIYASSVADKDFYDGGGGGTIRDFFSENEAWSEITKSLNSGFKLYDMGEQYQASRVSKDDHLIFVYKDGTWRWYGIMGD